MYRRRRPPLVVLVALAIAALVLTRGGGDRSRPGIQHSSVVTARVVRVVDGDTIAVRLRGRVEKVRYIGVDTPESVKPNTPVQCYAKRAAAFNQRLVGGRSVQLRFDRELRDRYGRLLAYVFTRRQFVNAELLRHGYATSLTIAPNDSRAGYLSRLEQRAMRRGLGLWSACPI
jgi:micrococcal nuclease